MRKMPALVAVAVGLWAAAALAQDGSKLTLNPVMSRGPAGAAVTIVEFSDYQ